MGKGVRACSPFVWLLLVTDFCRAQVHLALKAAEDDSGLALSFRKDHTPS